MPLGVTLTADDSLLPGAGCWYPRIWYWTADGDSTRGLPYTGRFQMRTPVQHDLGFGNLTTLRIRDVEVLGRDTDCWRGSVPGRRMLIPSDAPRIWQPDHTLNAGSWCPWTVLNC